MAKYKDCWKDIDGEHTREVNHDASKSESYSVFNAVEWSDDKGYAESYDRGTHKERESFQPSSTFFNVENKDVEKKTKQYADHIKKKSTIQKQGEVTIYPKNEVKNDSSRLKGKGAPLPDGVVEELLKNNNEVHIKWDVDKLEIYSEKVLDTVSKNVKKYRKKRGFTQMQLALEIGLSGGAYLGRVEIRKPNHHFNIKHIAKIAKVLDVDIKDFFEES